MLLAIVLGLVSRIGPPWTAALVVAAVMIGLEANILRVAGIGYGYDKDLLGWGTVASASGRSCCSVCTVLRFNASLSAFDRLRLIRRQPCDQPVG
jgi:hypothetical protein